VGIHDVHAGRKRSRVYADRKVARKHFQSLSRVMFGLVLGFSSVWPCLPAISRNNLLRDAFIPSAPAQTNTDRKKVAADEGCKRIAAGEYEVYEEAKEGLVGPFGEEVRNFHESWTLWQNAKRGYEAEGERWFETLKKDPQSHAFKSGTVAGFHGRTCDGIRFVAACGGFRTFDTRVSGERNALLAWRKTPEPRKGLAWRQAESELHGNLCFSTTT